MATSYLWDGTKENSSAFKVEAVDFTGNTTVFGPSTNDPAIPVPEDVTPPAWPNGSLLTAEAAGETGITLSWSPAVDRVGVVQYRLHMNGIAIKDVEGTVWRVENLKPSTEYIFKVEAADQAGNWSVNGPSLPVRTRSASYGGGGGGISSDSGPSIRVEKGLARVLFPETTAVDGKAAFSGTDAILADAFSKSSMQNGGKKVALVLPKAAGAKRYAVSVPASYLAGKDASNVIVVVTEWGTFELPGNMLGNHPAAQTKKEITVAIARSTLPASTNVPGESIAVLDIQMSADGTDLVYNNKLAPVQVRIPYLLSGNKQADMLNVWHAAASGEAELVPTGHYESSTEEMQFTVSRFSTFAVSYWRRSFADMDKAPWAQQAVEVLASKRIIDGVSETKFLPEASVTRGDFAKLLVNTLGLSVTFDHSFDDVQPGDYYYEAVGIAHKLGIVNGVEEGAFAPQASITRQDMFLMMARALTQAGRPVLEAGLAPLSTYSDGEDVAQYAQAAVASMVKAGLIEGSGGVVEPLEHSTRAETAVMLHRLFQFVFGQ
jgi:hypothetical protein